MFPQRHLSVLLALIAANKTLALWNFDSVYSLPFAKKRHKLESNCGLKDHHQSNQSANESFESMADSSDPPHGKATAQSTPPDHTPAVTNIALDSGPASVQSAGVELVVCPSPPQPKKSKAESKESKALPKKGKIKGKNKTSNFPVSSSNTKSATELVARYPDASLAITQLHRAAILASITGQPFEDVNFYAFSRRTRTRKAVSKALPLVANSRFIRNATAHFDSGTSYILRPVDAVSFGRLTFYGNILVLEPDTGVWDLSVPYPVPQQVEADKYDYISDSDLEDDEPVVDDSEDLVELTHTEGSHDGSPGIRV